jgi:threonine dehydrogenase-like Zn-dependent dehydrogenase
MRAGYYAGPGRFELREVADPTLREPDDVIVEVEWTGMCGTDLHIVSVPQLHPAKEGIVLGHEFVGRVVETGRSIVGLKVGDRVVAGPNIWCGQCPSCRRGQRKMCTNNVALGISTDGGFARFVRAPGRVLYPIPAGLSSEEAVFAEPLSCCLNGLHKLGPLGGARVVVLGAGPIGLYFIRLFRLLGAQQVLVTEPLASRRPIALRSGAHEAFAPDEERLRERLLDLTQGGADIVVDTVGSLLEAAMGLVRGGGQLLLFGMDQTCTSAVRPFEIVRRELTIHGCFVENDWIPRALELLPALQLGDLVTHRVGLSQIEEGFQAIGRNEAIKALVDVSR